jgi:DHA1 family multidrug resistance protein-like MFS transporter
VEGEISAIRQFLFPSKNAIMYPMENPEKQVSWQRTLYILFFAQLMVAVGFSSIFPFLPLYVEQLGSTTGMSIELLAGLVYSAQAFAMMVASPIWGAVADRFGRKLMVVRSMYGGAIILFLMAFVTSAEQLVLLRTMQGLITGTMAAASALLASVTPRRESGYAMGLLQVGFSVGTALGPLVGGVAADAFGYSAVFYITAAFLLLGGLTVTFGVHESFTPVKRKGDRNINLVSSWQSLLMLPGVFMIYVMRFVTSMGPRMATPIIPLFVQELLADSASVNTFTGLVLGISSGATMLSAVVLGKLGDRTGYRKILLISMVVLIGGYAAQGYVTAGWQFLALQALVGVALGGVIPIISAILANTIKAGDEGSAFGLDNSVTAAGRGVAPLVGAAVATAWGYPLTFVVTGSVFVVSTVLAVWRLPALRSAQVAAD